MTLGYSNPDEGVQQPVMYDKQIDYGKQKGESHGYGQLDRNYIILWSVGMFRTLATSHP